MKKLINFIYDLVSTGWSKCILETENQKIELYASYLSDALGDLSFAIHETLSGEEYSRATFTEEPGEYRWVFKRVNDKNY